MAAGNAHPAGISAPSPTHIPPSTASPPSPIGMVLQRERLHALIDARLPGAVWLHGPTGAGKTVLLRSYLHRTHAPSCWLTADERHRDPATLFTAITSAVAASCTGPLPAFSPEHRDDPAAFARNYFARLHGLLHDDCALVVDDVHHLADTTAPLLAHAIDAFAGRRCLGFASQLMPDASFAAHLAGSRLWIVGHRLLAFDHAEAGELAARLGTVSPSLDALVAATDGWAAGLMLAMQFGAGSGASGGSDPLESVRTPLALLIAGQVLGGVAKDDLARLRLLAELPQVPMEVADISPDWTAACARLQALSERGLFIERLAAERIRPDDGVPTGAPGVAPRVASHGAPHVAPRVAPRIARIPRGCWRLHDLFRNALREPGAIGPPDVALGAILVAGLLDIERLDLAWQLASTLGTATLEDLVAGHGSRALRDPHLLTMIPLASPHATREAPRLAIWQARALLGNDNAAALDACEEAFAGYATREDAHGTALATALALFVVFATVENVGAFAGWADRMSRVSRVDIDAIDDDEERSLRLAAEVVHDKLIASRATDPAEAIGTQDRLLAQVLAETLSPNESVLAGSLLVASMRRLNRRAEVEQAIVRIEALESFPRSAPHMRAMWKIENGYHFQRAGEVDLARKAFGECVSLAEENALLQPRIAALIGLVRLELGAGDIAEARRCIDALVALGAPQLGRFNGWVIHLQARYELSVGRPQQALHLLDAAEQLIRDARFPDSAMVLLDLDRIQLLYAMHRWSDCAPVIARIRNTGSTSDREQAETIMGLLEAHASWDSDRPRAEALLRQHMERAERLDLILFALLLPTVAARLASHALALRIAPAFVAKAVTMRKLAAPLDVSVHWPWPIRVELLTSFRITCRGTVLQSSGKTQQKPLELLKFLACEREMIADYNALTIALWPDAEAAAARKSLEVTVSRLRKLLDDDSLIVVREGKVALDATRISSDAKEFAALALDAESLAAKRPGDAEVAGIADRMLLLFRGLPLEHEDPTAWREAVRERYRNAFVRAVRALTAYWGDANDTQRAVGLLEAAIAREPLAESFYQMLMRIYIRHHQGSEAMRVYRQCRQMLSVLIGQAPSPETERIKQLIPS